MVACLLYSAPDVLSRRNFSSRFGAQDAIVLLQKCSNFKQMKQIHAKIIRNGLHKDQLIVTKLLRLCSEYRKIDYATLLLHQIQNRQTFTWNLLIRAYTSNDCSYRAIHIYNLMICRGVAPDKFTFPFVIKACLACSCVGKAKEVQGFAIKSGFFGDVYLENVLMDLYFKNQFPDDGVKVFDKMRGRNVVSWTTVIAGLISCGRMNVAQQLFDKMPVRNVVSWTAMINGYARSEKPEEAFELFAKMQLENLRPNEYTLVSLLIACAELGSLKLGQWIHDFAIKNGFEIGVFLGTALVDMYSKCGSLENAKRVFDVMETKSLATWNSMITSLGVHGCGEEALALFAKMQMDNIQPDAITLVGVLCACLQTTNPESALDYFNYMTERYSIMPSTDHYTSIVEIYCRSNKVASQSDVRHRV